MFEHRMYLPLAAVMWLLVLTMERALRVVHSTRRRQVLMALAASGAVSALSMATVRRNRDYHDELTMWRDVIAKRPHNARAHNLLGIALGSRGQAEAAVAAFERAIVADALLESAHTNLGVELRRLGHLDRAIAAFQEALPLAKGADRTSRIHAQHADTLVQVHRFDEAVTAYRKALGLTPDDHRRRHNLGMALATLGRLDEAAREFETLLASDPENAQARHTLTAIRERIEIERSVP